MSRTGVPLAAVVLCGGRSTRLGTDKALLRVGTESLVLRLARRLARVADPVLLAPAVPGRLGALGYPEVADERRGAGPLGGLAAALSASPHELLAVVAVDMPFASTGLLRLLAALHAGEDAVVPVTVRGPEPLHAVYAASALPQIRRSLAEDRLGLRGLLRELRVREVTEAEWRVADPDGRFALNINRREDLALLEGGGVRPAGPE